MRTDNLNRDVSVSAGVQSSNFKIVANAKMFSILADKLYSDKPRAVIREISCNALDAHGMNGQTKPFIISMPNVMEPMLTIRDFGPGMDDDTVMNVYTSFGESTKDGDNDQIGGFGLGCKSPFAYSDAFTVTVFQGGEKRNYAAYRGPDGVPQMSPIDTTPTDEPDGVEVRVPIKQADWYTFENTAEDLLQHFPEGSFQAFGLDVSQIKYQTKEPGYWVRETKMPRAYVLMGPVAYPLDWSLVVGPDDARLPETIVMVFNVGDLDLLPSREGLSYDKITISRLRARYDEICAQYAEGEFERVKLLNRFEQLKRIEELKATGTWKMITTRWPGEMEKDANGKSTGKTLVQPGFPGITDFIEFPGRPQMMDVSKRSSRSDTLEVTTRRMGAELETSVKLYHKNLGTKTAFVFDDLSELPDHKRRVPARMKQLYQDWAIGDIEVIFLDVRDRFSMVGNDRVVTRDIPGWSSMDELREFFKDWAFAHENVLLLSELDLPAPKSVNGVRRTEKTELRVVATLAQNFSEFRGRWSANCWREQGELVSKGVYVPLKGYDLDDDFDKSWFKYDFAYDVLVLGLSKKARQQIKRDGTGDDYERLDHYVQRKQKEALADPATLAELARSRGVAEMEKDDIVRTALKLQLGHESRESLFPGVTAAIREAQAMVPEPGVMITLGKVLNFYRLQGKEPPKTTFKSSVAREVKKAYCRSPLFRMAITNMRLCALNILRQNADIAALAKVTVREAYPAKED